MNVRNVMSKLLCFDSGNISCASVLTINNFRRHIRKSATKSDFHNLVLVTSFNRNIEHISMLLSQRVSCSNTGFRASCFASNLKARNCVRIN